MNSSYNHTNNSFNRVPNHVPIIQSNNSTNNNFNNRAASSSGTKNVYEFPALNTHMHPIAEDEFSNYPVIKDNSAMINRIKSSIQPKSVLPNNYKRISSALPIDSKQKNSINMNANVTSLIEENQKLRGEVSKLKQELSTVKKEITQLENEIDKKDKLIDEVAVMNTNSMNFIGSNTSQNMVAGISMKVIETKLVNGMKKQYKDLKKEYSKKNEEVEELKRFLKTTKLNELSIENQTLLEELNKIKNFYKISVKENQNKLQLVKEMEILQENFSKQQFMIISLQEKSENDMREINTLRNEVMRDKAVIAERTKKISELNRTLVAQRDHSKRLENFKDNQEYLQIKANWEKKMSDLRKDLAHYKQLSEKNGSRKKDLEDEVKRLRESIKNMQQTRSGSPIADSALNVIMDNPDENMDSKLQAYKGKMNDLYAEIKKLEKENKELKEGKRGDNKSVITKNEGKDLNNTISDMSHLNNTKLKMEHTNVSSNVLQNLEEDEKEVSLKEIDKMKALNEDSFNELIYILMKNFEANKIDSSVIESAFPNFEEKTTAEIVQNLAKSIMYLLKK